MVQKYPFTPEARIFSMQLFPYWAAVTYSSTLTIKEQTQKHFQCVFEELPSNRHVFPQTNSGNGINSGFDLYAPGSDQWRTQFRAIDCPTVTGINGNIKFRFVESNPWAMKLQTRNSRQVLPIQCPVRCT